MTQRACRWVAAALSLVSGLLPVGRRSAEGNLSPPRYRIIHLGGLAGRDATFPQAINNRGQVVGYAYRYVPPGHLNSLLSSPFLWENGRMRELTTLGGEFGHAYGINSAGDVVGSAQDASGNTRPVLWQRSRAYRPQPLSPEAGVAMCINNQGTIAGVLESPVLWKGRKVHRLPRPNSDPIRLTGLSETEELVGHTYADGRLTTGERAFRWFGGKVSPLPTLGGASSLAAGISGHDSIYGWSEDEKRRRWATLWRNGSAQRLNAPADGTAEAVGADDSGLIAGTAAGPRIWLGSKSYALADRVVNRGAWALWRTVGINGRGQIIGTGVMRKGRITDAFLLTPLKP